jgi:hypothetical protein
VAEIDSLINEAAALPRRYGFAPKNEEMYKSEGQRKAARYKFHKILKTIPSKLTL